MPPLDLAAARVRNAQRMVQREYFPTLRLTMVEAAIELGRALDEIEALRLENEMLRVANEVLRLATQGAGVIGTSGTGEPP